MRAVFHLLATLVKVVDPEDIRICTDTHAVSSMHALCCTATSAAPQGVPTSLFLQTCYVLLSRHQEMQLDSWPGEELQHSDISHPDCISEGD